MRPRLGSRSSAIGPIIIATVLMAGGCAPAAPAAAPTSAASAPAPATQAPATQAPAKPAASPSTAAAAPSSAPAASPSIVPVASPSAAASAPTTAPAAASGPAGQPYAGQTLTLETYANTPEFEFYNTLMPDFTRKTGIQVNFVQQPIAAMDEKVPLQLTAKDTTLDVFTTGSENIGHYVGISGVEPLDTYLNDSAQTPASYDFKDFAPDVESACQQGGKTYCIATHTGGGLLYYNTKIFQDAGITAPPQTPAELLQDAAKVHSADHAGFCVRGDKSQVLYDGFQIWNWFIRWDNPITGNYFDKSWNFLIGTEPQASQFGNFYRELLQKYAPDGIGTYLQSNCLQDFQQGRVAMWQDDGGAIPEVLDPEKSRVANDTAFWEVPCPPANPDHCALVQPFGIWMNAASTHKQAAWQLIQYLTSKDTQVAAATKKSLLTPSRASVVKDPAVVAALPKTFPEAQGYILAHPNVALLPFIPEGVAIIPPISNGLSDLITTDQPVADIMATMKAGENQIMQKAGYPKPFPTQ